ncbi:MAG: hypothetical protein IK088_08560, partial [Lachnospiraceae bacterium]|nr:hypothetical protein [Lachnospiraceae bacterium]
MNKKKVGIIAAIAAGVLVLGGVGAFVLPKVLKPAAPPETSLEESLPPETEPVTEPSSEAPTTEKVTYPEGITWYDVNSEVVEIKTKQDLLDLTELSYFFDFAGQTLKLEEDIVFNEGDAKDWLTERPDTIFHPIRNFAGTFDGQGHTISGIFIAGGDMKLAMFVNMKDTGVVENLRVTNSLIQSIGSMGAATFATGSNGTLRRLYSDATIIVDGGRVAGISAQPAGGSVEECWFNGEITSTGRYAGGIVDELINDVHLDVKHCLYTGTIHNDWNRSSSSIGGIVGCVQTRSVLQVEDCFSDGVLDLVNKVRVGAILGGDANNGNTTSIIKNCFATTECFLSPISSVATGIQGGAVGMARSKMIGKDAYSWLVLDFDNYWTTKEESTPLLQAFADKIETYEGVVKIFNVDWYDENQTEFEIHTLGELFGFALLSYGTNFAGKTVKLAEDIVINEDHANYKNWGKTPPSMSWMPIGNQGTAFAGTFDGQGHTISGMYYAGGNMSGFFAHTSDSAVVKNFNLKDSYVSASASNSGIVAGRGNGTYDTIYSNGIIVLRPDGDSAATGVGGIIGQIQMGTGVVNNCWFDGKVEIHGVNSQQCGGIVGHCVNTAALKMSNCLNTGTVTGDRPKSVGFNNLGGLVGFIGDNGTFECDGVLAAGKVEHLAGGCGSVFGHFGGNAYSTVSACYALSGMNKSVLGNNRGTVNGIIEVMQKDKLSGFKAYQWTDLDFDNYWAVNVSGLPMLKTWATSDPSVAGYSKMYDTSWYDPDKDEYVLTNWKELIGFSKVSAVTDFEGKTVKLGCDIVMNGRDASTYAEKAPNIQFAGIGSTAKPFKGTFDGQGHILSGIYMVIGTPCGGFFNATQQPALIKDVRMLNSYFESGANAVGSFAGRGNGTFMNLYSNAILNGVESTQGYGGIIGQVNLEDEKTDIMYCWFDGQIKVVEGSSTQQIGGILGQVINNGYAEIRHCLFTGSIEARRSVGAVNVGGIAGIAVGSLSNSKKYSPQLVVTDSFADGTIDQKGGLAGAVVGQAGYYSRVTIRDSYATRETFSSLVGGVNAENKDRDYHNNGSVFATSEITGTNAYAWMDLDFKNVWGCIADSTPRLRMMTPADQFASTEGVKKIDTSWYDPKATEYVITTRDQLIGLKKVAASETFKGKTIKLGADIDFNDNYADYKSYGETPPENEWTPIFSNASWFQGTFDGQGHAIRGLYIKSSTDYTAFMVESRGTIKNIRFENGYIESSGSRIATVVGRGCGTFEKVYTNCMVVGNSTSESNSFVGGILGQLTWKDATFTECWSEAEIVGNGTIYAGGGIAGNQNANKGEPVNVVMQNCLFNGSIKSKNSNYAGGLVGLVMNNNDVVTLTMMDCMTVGKIEIEAAQNTGSAIGGISSSQVVTLSKVYTAAGIATSGGTALKPIESVSGSLSGVISEKPLDELKGYGGFDNTLLDFDTYWVAIEDKTPELKWLSDETPLDCEGRERKDTSWYDPSAATYWIDSAQKLEYIAQQTKSSDFAGKTIIIANDIEYNADHESFADYATAAPKRIWPGIGGDTLGSKPFAGTIEGCGHTISGLYRAAGENELTGFVTEMAETGIVRNLQIKNAYFRTGKIAGAGA